MPITDPKLRQKLIERGYDPDLSQLASEQPQPVNNPTPAAIQTNNGPSAIGAGFRESLRSLPATATGLAAFPYGAKAGAALGTMVAPGPGTAIGGAIGGIGASVLTGLLTRMGQDAVMDKVAPSYTESQTADATQQPVASAIGGLASGLVGMKADPKAVVGAGRALRDIVLQKTIAPATRVSAADAGNLANVGLGAAVPTGVEYGQQAYAQGTLTPDIDPRTMLINALGGALISNPNKLGQKMGLTPNTYREYATDGLATAHPNSPKQQLLPPSEADLQYKAEFEQQPYIQEFRRKEAELAQKQQFLQEFKALKQADYEATQQINNELGAEGFDKSNAESRAQLEQSQREAQQRAQDYVPAKVEELRASDLVAKPSIEARPKPTATTELGKEIYPDYTGNQEIDAELNARVPLDEGEIIQDEYDRGIRKQKESGEPTKSPIVYRGAMEGLGGKKLHIWDLTEDVKDTQGNIVHPKGSTISEPTLQRLGIPYEIPTDKKSVASTIDNKPSEASAAAMDKLAQQRGVKLTRPNEVIADGESVAGITDLNTREAQISRTKGGLDSEPHEIQHNFFNDMLTRGTPAEKQLAQKALDTVQASEDYQQWAAEGNYKELPEPQRVEEFLTDETGIDFVRRVFKTDQNSDLKNFFKDVGSMIRERRGKADYTDHVRLQSRKLAYDPPASETFDKVTGQNVGAGVDESNVKKSKESQNTTPPDYYLETSEFLKSGWTFPKNTIIGKDQLINTIKNKYATEYSVLKEMGIEEFIQHGKTPEAVAKWIDENGPKIEVRELSADGDISPERREFARLQHEFFDELSTAEKRQFYDFNAISENDTSRLSGWAPEQIAKAEKYKALLMRGIDSAEGPKDNDSATAKYQMVNPKPLKDMEGAVDLLVRIPTPTGEEGIRARSQGKGLVKFQADKTHYPKEGNNLLAHVRGNMETLPDGKRVFHVFEMQSDWAQHVREYDQKFPENKNQETVGGGAKRDPLLKHYERLAIKAAINHARKQGADYIALSDAETAMITEGHDARKGYTPEEIAEEPEHVLIPQSKGMRLHYDDKYMLLSPDGDIIERFPTAEDAQRYAKHNRLRVGPDENEYKITQGKLNTILTELTGQKGEPVEFGEHQNAVEAKNQNAMIRGEQRVNGPRKDLIFKNPDGTPKTSITARMYPLTQVAKPLSMLNKRKSKVSNIEDNPNFKKWFEGSKVVDKEGKPLVVYHGTTHGGFTAFSTKFDGAHFGTKEQANNLLLDKEKARQNLFKRAKQFNDTLTEEEYFKDSLLGKKDAIMPVYLSIKNPKEVRDVGHNWLPIVERAKAEGFDGLKYYNTEEGPGYSYIAFTPEQIKSAIGNEGTFDGTNPDIRKSKVSGLLKSDIDKVKEKGEAGKIFGNTAEAFLEKRTENIGEYTTPMLQELRAAVPIDYSKPAEAAKQIWHNDNPVFQRVVNYFDAIHDKEQPNKLGAAEQKVAEIVRKHLAKVFEARNSREGLHQGESNPDYLPQMPNKATIDRFKNPAEHKKLQNELVAYYKKLGRSADEAKENFNELIAGYSKQEVDSAEQFGPLDKAHGVGLPKQWREQSLMARLNRYMDRTGRRLAFYDTFDQLENKDEILKSVKVDDNAKAILREIHGTSVFHEPEINAITGLVKSFMLGPITGSVDLTASHTLGMQHHQNPAQTVKAWMSSWKNIKQGWTDAYKTGRNRMNFNALEWDEANDITDGIRRLRDLVGTAGGRNIMEKISRARVMSEGRYLATDYAVKAAEGKLSRQGYKFFNDFGKDIDWKGGKLTEKDILKVAARYVDSVQGTYDPRGTDFRVREGALGPYLSLSRWSIEKLNNFNKHVIQEVPKGNWTPLLMSTLGMFIGGSAVNQVREMLSKRKQKNATWEELAAAKSEGEDIAPDVVYKLAALASASAYAGILGDLTKSVLDAGYGRSKPQTPNNVLIDAAGNIASTVVSGFKGAQDNGITPELFIDIVAKAAEDNIQAYRVALAHMSGAKAEDIERANKLRDLRTYNLIADNPISDLTGDFITPLGKGDKKKFKQTKDIGEAAELVPQLIEDAIKRAKGNPDLLKKNLTALKQNSYQTMPNPETMPTTFLRYITYLEKSQGSQAATTRLQDYLEKNAVNKAKASMIP
jgi:hypothetical protein